MEWFWLLISFVAGVIMCIVLLGYIGLKAKATPKKTGPNSRVRAKETIVTKLNGGSNVNP